MSNLSRFQSEINRHLAGVPPGENILIQCPFCQGGRNGEKSFSVRISESSFVVYVCFRASCGKRGGYWASGKPGDKVYPDSPWGPREFRPRLYTGETRELDSRWLSRLVERYALSPEIVRAHGWVQDVATGRLVCPIQGPYYEKRGYETRQFSPSDPGPKTLHFRELPGTWAHWPTCGRPLVPVRTSGTSPVVLVEDVISATKVSLAVQSCSIMGSYLTAEHLLEAEKFRRPIILALDRDASQKALAFQRKFVLRFPFRVLLLEKDLKYEPVERIIELIDSVTV